MTRIGCTGLVFLFATCLVDAGESAAGGAGFPERFSATYTLTEVVETDVEVHLTLSVAVSHDDPETVLDVRVRVERPGAPEEADNADWTLVSFAARDIHAGAQVQLTGHVILTPGEYATWVSGTRPRFHANFYANGEIHERTLDAVHIEPDGLPAAAGR